MATLAMKACRPKPEPEPDPDPTPHPETLNINENDIHEVLDLDGDGQIDAVVVDANGNEIPDAILDTTGDGNFDTLILDVEEDQTGDIVEIAGVNVVSNAEPTPVDPVDNNVLVINENDVYEAADMRGDGNVDTLIVDADGNENLDLVLDTTGDGNLDTLILDPGVDDDGNLIVDENNVVGIDGVVITPDEGLVNPDDENMAENQDIDDSALAMNDPNITIENNMDMDDFIA